MFWTKFDIEQIAQMPLVSQPIRWPVMIAGRQEEIAGWVFAPPVIDPKTPPVVVDMLPGATYRKDYWHLTGPGFPGKAYSLAQYLVEESRAMVLACDHLGTGESSIPPNGMALSYGTLAEVHAVVIEQLCIRLASGTLLPDVPPLPLAPRLVGIGHSMGAGILTRLQGHQPLYDALGLLGWPQKAVSLPGVDQEALIPLMTPNDQGYVPASPALRAALRPFFYGEQVPLALIEADETRATQIPGGALAELLTPGSTAAEAALIKTPVYLAFGEVDDAPDPREEVAAYRRAGDITLYVLPQSAHCHNLAPTRAQLWHHLAAWIRRLPARATLSQAA